MIGHLHLGSRPSDLCTVWYRTRWYLCDFLVGIFWGHIAVLSYGVKPYFFVEGGAKKEGGGGAT